LKFGGGRIFFSIFFGSQYVPIMFLLSFQWVPIRFSICFPSSQCFPQHVLLHTTPHFYPIYFGKCCPPLTYIGGPKGMNLILQIEPSILGSHHSFLWWLPKIGFRV
jgi:hypothetical protein